MVNESVNRFTLALVIVGFLLMGCAQPSSPTQVYNCNRNLTCLANSAYLTCGPAAALASKGNTTIYAEVRQIVYGNYDYCELYMELRDVKANENATEEFERELEKIREQDVLKVIRTICTIPHNVTNKLRDIEFLWGDEILQYCDGPFARNNYEQFYSTPTPTWVPTPQASVGPTPIPPTKPQVQVTVAREALSLEYYAPQDALFIGNSTGLFIHRLRNVSNSPYLPLLYFEKSTQYKNISLLKLENDYLYTLESGGRGLVVYKYFEENNTLSFVDYDNPINLGENFKGDGKIIVNDWYVHLLDNGTIYIWELDEDNKLTFLNKTGREKYSAIEEYSNYYYVAKANEVLILNADFNEEYGRISKNEFLIKMGCNPATQNCNYYMQFLPSISDILYDDEKLYLSTSVYSNDEYRGVYALDLVDAEAPTISSYVKFHAPGPGYYYQPGKLASDNQRLYNIGTDGFSNRTTIIQWAEKNGSNLTSFKSAYVKDWLAPLYWSWPLNTFNGKIIVAEDNNAFHPDGAIVVGQSYSTSVIKRGLMDLEIRTR